MPRQKRTSRIMEKAEFRAAGLKAIDSSMDFGDNCDLQNLTESIEQLRTMIDSYNAALAVIDSSKTKIDEMEKSLSNLSLYSRPSTSFLNSNFAALALMRDRTNLTGRP
ncbi:hypothetical protein PI95_014105 [Hassallia byssoidea VB512170]|uniref:Uncharacterized protein n=1 Tax=Hassallia byssoidea VB512170 TaxID=1304833 RepID=A0A846HB53_9CYAN|nr:hypothetical protein [Hassalia byssoidea]NEU73661.1 hypothetical protein [Hassalia byssoidea VB512170]